MTRVEDELYCIDTAQKKRESYLNLQLMEMSVSGDKWKKFAYIF